MIRLETRNGLKIIQILSGRSNVFLLTNGLINTLIDTSPDNKRKKLLKSLEAHGVGSLDYLILTHSHYDHSDNAAFLKKKFGCRVILHRAEEQNLITGEMSKPQGTTTITRFIVDSFADLVINKLQGNPCQPDILIDNNYLPKEFGGNVKIIHTPGHSPGSVCILVDNEISISGDTIFGVFKGRIFPPYAADVKLLISSWEKLLETGCSVFLPSHGKARSRELLQKEFNKRKAILSHIG